MYLFPEQSTLLLLKHVHSLMKPMNVMLLLSLILSRIYFQSILTT